MVALQQSLQQRPCGAGVIGHQGADAPAFSPLQQAGADAAEAVAGALPIHQGVHRARRMVEPLVQEVGAGGRLPLGIEALHRPLRNGLAGQQAPGGLAPGLLLQPRPGGWGCPGALPAGGGGAG